MAGHAITFDTLKASGCFASAVPLAAVEDAIRYKDAQGHTWDGNGDLPDWLQSSGNCWPIDGAL